MGAEGSLPNVNETCMASSKFWFLATTYFMGTWGWPFLEIADHGNHDRSPLGYGVGENVRSGLDAKWDPRTCAGSGCRSLKA